MIGAGLFMTRGPASLRALAFSASAYKVLAGAAPVKQAALGPMPQDRSGRPPPSGRNARGEFARGNKIAPGRAVATKNHRTILEQLLLDNEESITNSIIEQAKAGNPAAISVLGKWHQPRRAWRQEQVELKPPSTASEVREQLGLLVSKYMCGEIDDATLHAFTEAAKVIIDARSEELETLVKQVIALREK
jgi:hypothetical protein